MAANFPNSPSLNDTFTSNGVTFTWNGEAWKQPASPGVKGTKGDTGTKGEKGQKGDEGNKGQKGEIGLSGNPGGAGDKGQKGDTGTGDKGQKGTGGNDGTDGDKGDKGQKGTDGNDGTGVKGNKGEPGADGSDGTSVKGDKGQKGEGAKGQKGEAGADGSDGNDGTGIKGNKGEAGADGNFGGATFEYKFTDATVGNNTNITAGKLGLNNSNVTSATQLFIDDLDGGDTNTDIQDFLATIDDSTSTIKGHFRISNKLDADDFALFTISAASGQATFWTVTCAYVSGSASSFSNNEDVIITFARTGDQGQKGQKGDSIKGQKGTDGNDGTGVKGNKGEPGADGSDGTSVKGDKGQKGDSIKGQKGEAGADGSDGSDGTSVKGQKGEVGADNSTKGQKGESGADNSTKGQKGETGSANTTQAATVKVRTDNGDAFHNIVFVDSLTDNQFQIVKMDDENNRLQWNPSSEVLKAYRKQSYQVLDFASGSTGSAGQVLTSQGSSAAWTWTTPSTGGSTTINNNANNRVITGSGTANTLEGESNLTFDGSTLEVSGSGIPTIESGSSLNVTATSVTFNNSASFAGGHPTSNFYSGADDLVVANFTQDTGISIFSGTSNKATIAFGSTTFGTGALEARLFHDASTSDFIMQTQTAQHDIKLQSAGVIELGSNNDVIMTIEDPDLAASHGVEVSGTIYPKAPVGDLGLSGIRWNNIYGNYLHGDGSNITNLPVGLVKQIREGTSTAQSGVNSTSFVDKLSLTVSGILNNSRMIIIASYTLAASTPFTGGRNTQGKCIKDGGSFEGAEIINQTNSYGENFYDIFYDSANGAGSRTYKIQYRRLVGQTAYISNAKILAIELGIGP